MRIQGYEFPLSHFSFTPRCFYPRCHALEELCILESLESFSLWGARSPGPADHYDRELQSHQASSLEP